MWAKVGYVILYCKINIPIYFIALQLVMLFAVRQCEACCCDSEDDLKPTKVPDWVNSSRSGRAINKPPNYQLSEDQQVQRVQYCCQ